MKREAKIGKLTKNLCFYEQILFFAQRLARVRFLTLW